MLHSSEKELPRPARGKKQIPLGQKKIGGAWGGGRGRPARSPSVTARTEGSGSQAWFVHGREIGILKIHGKRHNIDVNSTSSGGLRRERIRPGAAGHIRRGDVVARACLQMEEQA